MDNFINRLISLFTEKDCYGNKVYNSNENNNFDTVKYYELIKKVRNYVVLDNTEIEFIKTLPQKELVEIIEFLNIHVERVTELFRDMETNIK